MAESSDNFFKQRREELNLSQHDIVHEFHPTRITVGAVSGWERGQVPNLNYVDDIARVYRVTPRKVLEVLHEMARERSNPPVAAK